MLVWKYAYWTYISQSGSCHRYVLTFHTIVTRQQDMDISGRNNECVAIRSGLPRLPVFLFSLH